MFRIFLSGFGWQLAVLVGVLASAVGGAITYAWWVRRAARLRRRAPKHWPLSPRVVTNIEERKIWRWLNLAFLDHSVMIKMPVTRFTMPNSRKHGLHWYELLSGLYCTFTIVRADGHVIGCVDLAGRFADPSRAQRMKVNC